MLNTFLLVFFSMMRAFYSATIEAFVTWGCNLILASIIHSTPSISYSKHYIFWFVIGTIVACLQYKNVLN